MKRCPTCNQQFSDEYAFCLNDGTNLVPAGVTISYDEQQTVVRSGEQNTVVRGAGAGAQSPTPSKGIPFYVWLLPLLGLIVIVGLIGGYFIISKVLSSGTTTVANTNTNTVPTFSPTPYGGTPMSTVSPTPYSTPTVNMTPPPPPTPQTTPPPQLAKYPSTQRLNFARGAVSTSFSGDVNPGGSRSVVLACRAGQTLSASVSSSGGCVTIRGGGSSYRTSTSSGDNYVTLSNSCSNVAHFSFSVSVL